MANLINPPAKFSLPLSRGQDLVVDFQNQDTSGNALDYPDGAAVALIIDATTADGSTTVTQAATVSGNHATVFVPYATTDTVLKGLWRCVITLDGVPVTHIVACNGTIARSDGN